MSRAVLRNPVDGTPSIRAVLFDVDGTLYDQRRLRLRMAAELAGSALTAPRAWPRRWRALSAFRAAQERLRHQDGPVTPKDQIDLAARESGLPPAEIAQVADEWIGARPLRHLDGCRAAGLDDLLADLRAREVALGVLSDYPAQLKLDALGLGGAFAVILCTTDGGVNAYKPHPAGFRAAAAAFGLPPEAVLMVGDRPEVDGRGAAAAGMPAVIVGSHGRAGAPIPGCVRVSTLIELRHALMPGDRPAS